MLDKLFLSLRDDKKRYLNAKLGREFEERIMQFLQMTLAFTRILKEDLPHPIWKTIKSFIGGKLNQTFLDVPLGEIKRTFIYQPYGSQQFPDLLLFTDSRVIPLEIKFSTRNQSSPIWNSNVPRANAFYVFGSYGRQDITFFCGDDIIAPKHRESLYGFFDNIRVLQDEARVEIPGLDVTNRGFTPYIRPAFCQKKHKPEVETNFFLHRDRKEIENLAIERARGLDTRSSEEQINRPRSEGRTNDIDPRPGA